MGWQDAPLVEAAGTTGGWQSAPLVDQPQATDQPRSWSDVGWQALKNARGSAYQFGSDIVQPCLHPVQTLENIGNLQLGLMQKAGLYGGDSFEKYPEAVGGFLKDRYGGVEEIKKTLAT